jgi:hypothetical protein
MREKKGTTTMQGMRALIYFQSTCSGRACVFHPIRLTCATSVSALEHGTRNVRPQDTQEPAASGTHPFVTKHTRFVHGLITAKKTEQGERTSV